MPLPHHLTRRPVLMELHHYLRHLPQDSLPCQTPARCLHRSHQDRCSHCFLQQKVPLLQVSCPFFLLPSPFLYDLYCFCCLEFLFLQKLFWSLFCFHYSFINHLSPFSTSRQHYITKNRKSTVNSFCSNVSQFSILLLASIHVFLYNDFYAVKFLLFIGIQL